MSAKPSAALITGASSGIGRVYADRLARRGRDVVLVARDVARLEDLARRLRAETGVAADVLQADLASEAGLGRVEERLRRDRNIGLLVNNAGAAGAGGFAAQDPATIDQLIRLNVLAPTRLAMAAIPGFLERGDAAIINIASVLALVPEMSLGVYGPTKSYLLGFSQALQAELGSKGLYVQAVLPAATRTEIWERSGRDINTVPGVMEVDALVDAALAGFDRREPVTLPSLPDEGQWQAFEAARQAMLPNFLQSQPAARYRA